MCIYVKNNDGVLNPKESKNNLRCHCHGLDVANDGQKTNKFLLSFEPNELFCIS